MSALPWIRVDGDRFVDDGGQEVRLRGVSLGGWMNMENFITGYPGAESGIRSRLAAVLDGDVDDTRPPSGGTRISRMGMAGRTVTYGIPSPRQSAGSTEPMGENVPVRSC